MIPLFYPYLPKQKILKELKQTLDSKWVGQGPKVDLFEAKFGRSMSYKYPIMVNSGTSALELSYHLTGLKKGDKVVVPVLNAVAGNVGLVRRGCELIFCDIECDTLNIDPVHLAKILSTNKISAVVGVHLGGIHINPKIYSICKDAYVPLIVDAAEYMGKTHGDYICYSFQAIKHITTGDGGMLVVKNKKDYQRAKSLRWFGLNSSLKVASNYKSWERRKTNLEIDEAGYKFHPTDIDASFALAAFGDLPKIIRHRKKLAKQYQKGLEQIKEISTISGGTYWLFTILAQRRDELATYLTNKKIECNLVNIRNDQLKVFGGKKLKLANMDWVEGRYLCLPLNDRITKSHVSFICKTIRQFYSKKSSGYSKKSSAYSKKSSGYK